MKEDLKIVSIFNKNRLRNAIGSDNYNLPFCTTKILTTTKYLFISESQVSNSEIANWDIVLNTDDNVNFDDTKVFNRENSLVMFHQFPTDSANKLSGKALKFIRGYHDNDEGHGYTLLKFLILAWDDQKDKFKQPKYNQAIEKLIKWFRLNVKLNKALYFLHMSLGDTPADQSILKNGEEKFDFLKDFNGKTLNTWIESLNGKTGDEYKKTLADVRDALLKEAGAIREN